MKEIHCELSYVKKHIVGTNKRRRDVHVSYLEFYDVQNLCCRHVRVKKSNICHRGHTVVQLVQSGMSKVLSRWGRSDFSLT